MMSMLFVGGGNMASALVGGMMAHGQSAQDIAVVEVNRATAEALAARWDIRVHDRLPPDLGAAGTVVLAVKPQQMDEVLASFPPLDPALRIISIAAGWTTARLSAALRGHGNVVRAMPNTPALVQAGTTALFAMPGVNAEDRAHAQALMRAVGHVHWLDDEQRMDAVTALSGSGPAYVFYLMEAMLAAATTLGLDETMARAMVLETVQGAAQLAYVGKEDAALLRHRVTSPGGTTAAALEVLMQGQWSETLQRAVQAACRRSETLARPSSGVAS